jgi:hypothetical protein
MKIYTKLIFTFGCIVSTIFGFAFDQVALNPGCITSGNQLIFHGTIPHTITATPASNGTCSGSYSYQWLKSTNDTFFVDIPGATSQNLAFTDSIPQTTYYQRKTICGSEVKFTLSVKVEISWIPIYYNSPTSDDNKSE